DPHLRVPTLDDALEDDRRGWPLVHRGLDELRQSLAGVQQRVEPPRAGSRIRGRYGLDILCGSKPRDGDQVGGIPEATLLAEGFGSSCCYVVAPVVKVSLRSGWTERQSPPQRSSSRPSAARTASRIATRASSRAAGESSRTCSSMPSATGTRRQLSDWSSFVIATASARTPSAGAREVATRRSSESPVRSRSSVLMESSVAPSRCRILMARSWRKC